MHKQQYVPIWWYNDYVEEEIAHWHDFFQQVFANVDGAIVMSIIIHKHLCDDDNGLLLFKIMATTIFMSGICTIVMATIGVR